MQAMSVGGNNITTSEIYRDLSNSGVQPSMSGYRVGDQLFQSGIGGRGGAGGPPAPADDGKPHIYPSTAYPSATTMAQGTVITLGSGESRSAVDLQLRLMPTVRVSVTVSGPDGPGRNIGIKLYVPGADYDRGVDLPGNRGHGHGCERRVHVPWRDSGRSTLKIVRVPRPPPVPMTSSNSTTIEVAGPAA